MSERRAPAVTLVDYGVGNTASVIRAFRRLGAEVDFTPDLDRVAEARRLVLPGVAAFAPAMNRLLETGLESAVRAAVKRGGRLLGLCLGFQLLFEESEEHGRHAGLGFLPGRVRRFEGDLPVPHMGWNRLRGHRPHPILDGIADGAHVYFVHSYYCDAPSDVVIASSDYGHDFAAIVGRGSVLGVQFHPEKSQDVGLRMVESFVRVVDAARRAA